MRAPLRWTRRLSRIVNVRVERKRQIKQELQLIIITATEPALVLNRA